MKEESQRQKALFAARVRTFNPGGTGTPKDPPLLTTEGIDALCVTFLADQQTRSKVRELVRQALQSRQVMDGAQQFLLDALKELESE